MLSKLFKAKEKIRRHFDVIILWFDCHSRSKSNNSNSNILSFKFHPFYLISDCLFNCLQSWFSLEYGVHASTDIDHIKNAFLSFFFFTTFYLSLVLLSNIVARILFFRNLYVFRDLIFRITILTSPETRSFSFDLLFFLVTYLSFWSRSFDLKWKFIFNFLKLAMNIQIGFTVFALEKCLFDSFLFTLRLVVKLETELLTSHINNRLGRLWWNWSWSTFTSFACSASFASFFGFRSFDSCSKGSTSSCNDLRTQTCSLFGSCHDISFDYNAIK